MKYFVFVFLSVLVSSQVFAERVEPNGVDILEILESYSKSNDVKFVVDPRIRGQVNMIGLKLEEIDKTDLNNILQLHGMTAYKKSDVVYIVPAQREEEFGEKWEAAK